MKRLLSLFDYSGQWAEPFAVGGWDVIQWDIKLYEFMDVKNIDSAEIALELFEDIDGILAAPPCTDFTASCAQYWPMKDADGRTAAALALVRQVQKLANLFTPTDPEYDGGFFWVCENPVGRLPKLCPELGKGYFFNPYEFAGYLSPGVDQLAELDRIRKKEGKGVTKQETDFVLELNAYTKKTGLWGDFNRNIEKKIIEPVKVCAQGSPTQRSGGKSSKTKEDRSNTPAGFAQAFYEANKDYQGSWAMEI